MTLRPVAKDKYKTLDKSAPRPNNPLKAPLMNAKRKALLADDNEDARECLRMMLEYFDFEVVAAEDGLSACAHLQNNDFDLVVTDHDMPHKSGLELVHTLRKQAFPGRICVVSGGLREADITAYRAAGVTQIAAKPITVDRLKELVGD